MITLIKLKQYIKRQKKKNRENLNFLGLVETNDLSKEVESLFAFITPYGHSGFDWVNGNDKLRALIKSL